MRQKSPNILLSEKDEAKISDVGLGKLIAGPSVTATQQGSFLWASPEQLLGTPTTIASDIFSMGTVRALTGPPYNPLAGS